MKSELFTHVGEVVCRNYRGELWREWQYLYETSTAWVRWLEHGKGDQYRKPKEPDAKYAELVYRSNRPIPNQEILLVLSTVRRATSKDYIEYYQSRIARERKVVQHIERTRREAVAELRKLEEYLQGQVAKLEQYQAELSAYCAREGLPEPAENEK